MKNTRSFFQQRDFHFIPLLISPFLVPFLLFPIDVTYFIQLAAVFISLSLWLATNHRIQIPIPALLALGLLLLGQAALYFAGGIVNIGTWNLGIFMILACFTLFIMAASSNKSQIENLSNLYIFIALLWSFAGLYCWLGGTNGQPLMLGPFALAVENSLKLSGPFAQGNIFAGMVGIAWLIVLWKILFKRNDTLFDYFLFFLLTMFSICSMSKGAWIAQLIVGTILIMLNQGTAKETFFNVVKLLAIFLLALITAYLLIEMRTETSTAANPMDLPIPKGALPGMNSLAPLILRKA